MASLIVDIVTFVRLSLLDTTQLSTIKNKFFFVAVILINLGLHHKDKVRLCLSPNEIESACYA